MTRSRSLFTSRGRNTQWAFTMIEIMIVILVIGIIVGIAVPTWLKSRNTTQAKVCQETQAQLEGAIERWAFANNKISGETGPTYDEIIGPESLMKKTPKCPIGPTEYEIPKIGIPVVCPNIDEYPAHKK